MNNIPQTPAATPAEDWQCVMRGAVWLREYCVKHGYRPQDRPFYDPSVCAVTSDRDHPITIVTGMLFSTFRHINDLGEQFEQRHGIRPRLRAPEVDFFDPAGWYRRRLAYRAHVARLNNLWRVELTGLMAHPQPHQRRLLRKSHP